MSDHKPETKLGQILFNKICRDRFASCRIYMQINACVIILIKDSARACVRVYVLLALAFAFVVATLDLCS